MGDARVVLTLMNADGEITQRHLPPVGEETIQLVNNRFAPFHAEESQVDTGQLARFCKFRQRPRLPWLPRS